MIYRMQYLMRILSVKPVYRAAILALHLEYTFVSLHEFHVHQTHDFSVVVP